MTDPATVGPDVLLPYQKEALEAVQKHKVVIIEKSRRIGLTWALEADAVVTAAASRTAGGQDYFYLAYNLDMTREFIEGCARWARAFGHVISDIEGFLWRDGEGEGARDIQAFRVRGFASGFEIVALSSAPRNLRGKQGKVCLDEAAFAPNVAEVLKAGLALLMWGGSLIVNSTHDGEENPFNELIAECRAGKRPFHVLRFDFARAIADGLYQRICLVNGTTWTPEGELAWVKEIRELYGDAATEELDCIPRKSGGRYLPRTLLEARAVDAPVIKWTPPKGFVDFPEECRIEIVDAWCEEHLAPLLVQLGVEHGDEVRSFFGQDFARSKDVSTMWPLLLDARLHRHTPFVVELRDVPYTSQLRIASYLIRRLPRFGGAALDATGNGGFLAEALRQEFGADFVAEVKLSVEWYREHMPKMKACIEDGTIDIPKHADIIDDFRLLALVAGVARVIERTTDAEGGRHGDSAIACALAVFASFTIEAGEWNALVEGSRETTEAFAGDAFGSRKLAGWDW